MIIALSVTTIKVYNFVIALPVSTSARVLLRQNEQNDAVLLLNRYLVEVKDNPILLKQTFTAAMQFLSANAIIT